MDENTPKPQSLIKLGFKLGFGAYLGYAAAKVCDRVLGQVMYEPAQKFLARMPKKEH